LSWSGVNPLGDVNGDGIVNQTDVNIVNAAMGTSPSANGGTLVLAFDRNFNGEIDYYQEDKTLRL